MHPSEKGRDKSCCFVIFFLFFFENVWSHISLSVFNRGGKCNCATFRSLSLLLLLYESSVSGCVLTHCYMYACIPSCLDEAVMVHCVIYWKALRWHQNSFALNACSECLLLPACFMDHDHTRFISHFHISEDGSCDFSVFIRVSGKEARGKREETELTLIPVRARALFVSKNEIASSRLWQ